MPSRSVTIERGAERSRLLRCGCACGSSGVAACGAGGLTTWGRRRRCGGARARRALMLTTLWEAELPASAQATPMTYWSRSGKQFVVIAAGGHALFETKRGDHVVAFALP